MLFYLIIFHYIIFYLLFLVFNIEKINNGTNQNKTAVINLSKAFLIYFNNELNQINGANI